MITYTYYFRITGTCSEQLPTDASVEVALAKNEDDSGVITNNTKEDNVKIINCIPETVKDSKFANFQEEMQGELDNGMANKGNFKILHNCTNIRQQTKNISL